MGIGPHGCGGWEVPWSVCELKKEDRWVWWGPSPDSWEADSGVRVWGVQSGDQRAGGEHCSLLWLFPQALSSLGDAWRFSEGCLPCTVPDPELFWKHLLGMPYGFPLPVKLTHGAEHLCLVCDGCSLPQLSSLLTFGENQLAKGVREFLCFSPLQLYLPSHWNCVASLTLGSASHSPLSFSRLYSLSGSLWIPPEQETSAAITVSVQAAVCTAGQQPLCSAAMVPGSGALWL